MTRIFCLLLAILGLSACGSAEAPVDINTSLPQSTVSVQEADKPRQAEKNEPGEGKSALRISVGDYEFLATFEDNLSAQEFKKLLSQGPITLTMEDYGGFEKVGPLGTTLTPSDQQITTQPGDIILYQGSQITIYYGTNSWDFTRLARINDPTDLKAKLGVGTIHVTFSLA